MLGLGLCPGLWFVTVSHNSGAVDCADYKRLVAIHLKAIAEWKNTFDDPGAWDKVIDSERIVVEHYQEHGCRETSAVAEPVQHSATKY